MTDPLLQAQLQAVRAARIEARRQRYRRSRLDRFRAEIETLANAGASHRDIQLWLRQFKRTKVDARTVGRALARWRASRQETP